MFRFFHGKKREVWYVGDEFWDVFRLKGDIGAQRVTCDSDME